MEGGIESKTLLNFKQAAVTLVSVVPQPGVQLFWKDRISFSLLTEAAHADSSENILRF
jgi:hypothetical protein